MPPIPPTSAPPYDTATDVLNAARARLNDDIKTLLPTGGKLLANNQVFSQQVFNTAWRKFQEALSNWGYSRLRRTAIIQALPQGGTLDPGIPAWLDWTGYYDGANFWPGQPAAPSDMILPIRIEERQTGTNATFCQMENVVEDLPTWQKCNRNGFWHWEDDKIFMPGAQLSVDLRIRYNFFLPDIEDIGTDPWFSLPVPITHCTDSLSLYVCAELARARLVELEAAPYYEEAEAMAKLLMNRDVQQKQRVNLRRQSRSGRLEGYNRDYCY